ncbi:MAG: MarR family transcriptional regulator [Hyphomicrobium sp.]
MAKNEEQSIGYLISDAARLMRTVFDRRVHRLGLTRAQWLVLARLHRSPGASQSELADMMEVEKASAGRMVDRLERKGWVVRRPDPADRRINRLYLTPDAEKISKRMRTVAEQTVDDAMHGLTQDQIGLLTSLLESVKTRLLALSLNDDAVTRANGKTRKKTADANGAAIRRHRAMPASLAARGSAT